MSVRFFNGYMTTGSAAAANESACVRFSSACNAMLLILDTVIAVSIFVIIGLLVGSLNGIISLVLSVGLVVSLILIIRIILRTQIEKRPKPFTAI